MREHDRQSDAVLASVPIGKIEHEFTSVVDGRVRLLAAPLEVFEFARNPIRRDVREQGGERDQACLAFTVALNDESRPMIRDSIENVTWTAPQFRHRQQLEVQMNRASDGFGHQAILLSRTKRRTC